VSKNGRKKEQTTLAYTNVRFPANVYLPAPATSWNTRSTNHVQLCVQPP